MGKFLALGHATRPSYGGPNFDSPDFQLDFALWNFASFEGEVEVKQKNDLMNDINNP